jgi:hypothetical protein
MWISVNEQSAMITWCLQGDRVFLSKDTTLGLFVLLGGKVEEGWFKSLKKTKTPSFFTTLLGMVAFSSVRYRRSFQYSSYLTKFLHKGPDRN